MRWYLALIPSSRTWSRPKSSGECKSVIPEDDDARKELSVLAEWK